ncbi:MAG: hypothetical protein EBU52_02800 [Cytophagia bacterium]|nr:hypothetical protein [Cytophagia bacterium]
MKIVKPEGTITSVSFYAVIGINILITFLYLESSENKFPIYYALVTLLVVNIFFYFMGVSDHYQFEYDDNELIVTNTWNPLFYRTYKIRDLEKIEWDYFNNLGKGIRIFHEGTKDVFICASYDDRLKIMVAEINVSIKSGKKYS